MEESQEKLKCPKCNSTQLTADKRGFNTGKAVVGAVLTGGVGLLAGLHGKDNIVIYCMSCGENWKPSEYNDKVQRAINNRKVKDDFDKLKRKQEYRKKLSIQRYEFMKLYKKDKSEALLFAKHHQLPRHASNNVDVVYDSFRSEIKKEILRQIIAGGIFILLVILLLYMCSNN